MDDGIDDLKLKERCLIMVIIKNEMQRNLNEYFANSEYNKIFKENSVVATMDYRGIYLEISHETKYRFQTSQYTYTFEYVNSMQVNDKETGETKYYDYFESDGVLERFEDRYGSKSSSKGSSQSNSSGNSKFKNNGSSSSGNKKAMIPMMCMTINPHRILPMINMRNAVYENFVRQIAGDSLKATNQESLKDSVDRDNRRQDLQKQIDKLQQKVRKEKQLNRQMQMNTELKALKRELDELT